MYGTDYDTEEGTCIRDYIHVVDLAKAHVLALEFLKHGGKSTVYNLGSEKGFSVQEIIESAKKITKKDFVVIEEGRRAGDPAVLIASSEKITKELGWKPTHSTVDKFIDSAYNWYSKYPNGY